MRSRLEAKVAAGLDLHGIDWEYEPLCYAGPEGQYLPDFQVNADWPQLPTIILEIKGLADASDHIIRPIMAQMELVWESDPSLALVLDVHSPKGNTIWMHRAKGAGPCFDDDSNDWWDARPVPAGGIAEWLCWGCETCVDAEAELYEQECRELGITP